MTSDRSDERGRERGEDRDGAPGAGEATDLGGDGSPGLESPDGPAMADESGRAASEATGTEAPETSGPAAEPAGEQGGGVSAVEHRTLNERFLRLAAEYDNFRKRTERERTESWVRAQAELVKKLLDPLDDLQRVADYTVENTSVEALLEGVQMVERKLLRALEGAGLEVIDATGQPFDPSVHEALMTAPADSADDDESVGDVLQKGYGFKGVLLRPARVQVRKYEG